MKDSVREYVLAAVGRKAKLPADVDVETFNYIDSGYVDSIEIIKFVVDIEAKFNVEISDADLGSPEFRTVGGLVAIINRKMASGGRPC
jgi:acyl carrier protein